MGDYTLSGEADTDLEEIAESSLKGWGLVRAERYILELRATFQRLAEFPGMGTDASHIRAGYLMMHSASHSVFYRKAENGILIVRVLHGRMDFGRHL